MNAKTIPTTEQLNKIDELEVQGYKWNKPHSVSAAGVVLDKGKVGDSDYDFWFFGLDGEIMHNPKGFRIEAVMKNGTVITRNKI